MAEDIFIYEYMWVLFVLVGALNALYGKYRLRGTLREHPEWTEEANTFLKGYFLYMTVPFLFLMLLQFAGGYKNPFYMFLHTFSIYQILAWVVLFFFWYRLFHYVFFQGGAKQLAKFHRALGNIPPSEIGIKILTVILLTAAIGVFIIGYYWGIGEILMQ
ncbi:MAG: hypothetical protein HXS41_07585 [Theionarchaea archaeon]|nr:hypothetical protein [Theionarchaea archaeon]MBU7000190.1 hypothetical protein [Theionarchaea archaeon]MBU7020907.1 hypothetical protein [Theionarchaea archaeon]MBU7033959.1 hypothetical protein [Theionarchaea archaeon]MBU7040545.1 hypothetical protein [Theionarchaea archaeon]